MVTIGNAVTICARCSTIVLYVGTPYYCIVCWNTVLLYCMLEHSDIVVCYCSRDQMMLPMVLCCLMVVSYSYELLADSESLHVQSEFHSQTSM